MRNSVLTSNSFAHPDLIVCETLPLSGSMCRECSIIRRYFFSIISFLSTTLDYEAVSLINVLLLWLMIGKTFGLKNSYFGGFFKDVFLPFSHSYSCMLYFLPLHLAFSRASRRSFASCFIHLFLSIRVAFLYCDSPSREISTRTRKLIVPSVYERKN